MTKEEASFYLANMDRKYMEESMSEALDMAIKELEQESRKGQWLRMSDLSEQLDDRYKCSYCGNVVHHTDKMNLYTFNSWCGRCGSDNGRNGGERMTRERTIEQLKLMLRCPEDNLDDEDREAVEVCIKALEQEPCDDCISRQAVIESIKKQYTEHNELIPEWLSIGDLPPVSPQQKVEVQE